MRNIFQLSTLCRALCPPLALWLVSPFESPETLGIFCSNQNHDKFTGVCGSSIACSFLSGPPLPQSPQVGSPKQMAKAGRFQPEIQQLQVGGSLSIIKRPVGPLLETWGMSVLTSLAAREPSLDDVLPIIAASIGSKHSPLMLSCLLICYSA